MLSSVNSTPTTMMKRPSTTCAVTRGRNGGGSPNGTGSVMAISTDGVARQQAANDHHEAAQHDEQRPRGGERQAEDVVLRNQHPSPDPDQPEAARRVTAPAGLSVDAAADERAPIEDHGGAERDQHERRDEAPGPGRRVALAAEEERGGEPEQHDARDDAAGTERRGLCVHRRPLTGSAGPPAPRP